MLDLHILAQIRYRLALISHFKIKKARECHSFETLIA